MLCHIKSKYNVLSAPGYAVAVRHDDILHFVKLRVYASQSACRLFGRVLSLLLYLQHLLVYVSVATNIISLLRFRAKGLNFVQPTCVQQAYASRVSKQRLHLAKSASGFLIPGEFILCFSQQPCSFYAAYVPCLRSLRQCASLKTRLCTLKRLFHTLQVCH